MTPEVEGRLALAKTFTGDLVGTSAGTMLSTFGSVKGSASYVAIETVTGTLDGRHGSFVLVHRGVMSAAGQELEIRVSPDSGTGDLEGLSGSMEIHRDAGDHSYTLHYTLPAKV